MFKNKTHVLFCFIFTLFVAGCLNSAAVTDVWAATRQDTPPSVATEKNEHSFNEAVKTEEGHRTPSISPEKLSGGSAAARAPFTEVKTGKATGANAYTVAEIFAASKKLNGKTVRVRGQVVRYNPAIMGRNWIHIQDGTGDPLKNTHDLVATSTETAKVGEVVTVEGKLAADKDFGAGYVYAAIVEGAKLVK